MKRVILESPLGNRLVDGVWTRVLPGSFEYNMNIEYAKVCVLQCLFRGEAPFASHLLYAQPDLLDDGDEEHRELGIRAGLAWSEAADYVVVFQDYGISPGMERGIKTHEARGLKIEYRNLPTRRIS